MILLSGTLWSNLFRKACQLSENNVYLCRTVFMKNRRFDVNLCDVLYALIRFCIKNPPHKNLKSENVKNVSFLHRHFRIRRRISKVKKKPSDPYAGPTVFRQGHNGGNNGKP